MYTIISHLCEHLVLSVVLILAVQECVGGIFLIYRFLMINNVKYLFVIHLAHFDEVSV